MEETSPTKKGKKDYIANENFFMLKLVHYLVHQTEFIVEAVMKNTTLAPSV